jgi:hypothetical protein
MVKVDRPIVILANFLLSYTLINEVKYLVMACIFINSLFNNAARKSVYAVTDDNELKIMVKIAVVV